MGIARDGNGLLNILWSRGTEVLNTQISANARDVTGPHGVFVYDHPSGSAGPTALVAGPDGTLRAFFAGRYPVAGTVKRPWAELLRREIGPLSERFRRRPEIAERAQAA